MISAYLPSATGLLGLAATLIVLAALIGVGRLAVPGAGQAESWFVAGYGLVLLVVTTIGTATTIPLIWLYVVFLAVGAVGLLRFIRDGGELGRAVVLALPLLVLLAGASASQWDEFSNWLPKHRYLLEFDSFPRAGMPPSTSALPAYPDGLPLIGYFVGRTTGFFVENAGALFNTLLIAVAGLLVARNVAAGAAGTAAPRTLSWGHVAIGLLAVTILNPTFVPKLVFTAYLDWTTSVVLALMAIGGWRVVEALAVEDFALARREALLVGLAMTVFVDLKQANLVLAGLVVAGMGLALLRTPNRPIGAAFRLVPVIVLPPAVIYLAWRSFVAANMPGGEFSFMPFDQWLWNHLGDIAGRMVLIASTKSGYFGLMTVLSGIAIWSCVRPASSFSRLAIVVATVFLGYNAFLYVTYVGAFGPGEGLAAASYWRYNTQLGVLAVAGAAYGVGILWRRYVDHLLARWVAGSTAAIIAVALVLIGPIAQAKRLRFDINPARTYVRGIGAELAGLLPPRSQLATIDRLDNGQWALYIRYELGRTAAVRGISGGTVTDPDALRVALSTLPLATYVWVHVPEPSIEAALAVSLAPKNSHLLVRAGDRWQLTKSWPWPGYGDPHVYDK